MNESRFSRTLPTVLAGVLGGLAVVVVGALLISTNVIETGTRTEVVRDASPTVGQTQPVSRPEDGQRSVADIYKREGRGVVFVQTSGATSESDSPFGLPNQGGTATGSGFVVDDDGTILTNAHVVEGSDDVQIRVAEDGDFIDAKVAGRDPSSDLAVLEVDPEDADLTPLPLGDSSKVAVGDPVIAIGNPFGLTRTVTTGIASALQRSIEAPNGFTIPDVIQTDASINPGNSGGPLLDADGDVIGINSQIATGGSSQGSVGIGFAVPINTAKKLLPALAKGNDIERSYLGVRMAPVTDQIADELRLAADSGALVQAVVSGGPADEAGLTAGNGRSGSGGDLIVKVDGETIRTPDDVSAAIADDQPGDTVEIEYFDGEDRKTADVKLGKRPAQALRQPSQSLPDGGGLPNLPDLP